MKNWKTIIIAFIILISVPAFAQQDISKYVKPLNYVNDYAQIISPGDEDALNTKLSNYEKSAGVEIAILTIDEENIEPTGFSQQIFEQWGIGKEGSNNGILIFLNMNTHDWRIHTGYGAEILLPDLACDRLAQELLIPQFREGNYTAGINSLTDGMISKIGTNSADIEAFKQQQIEIKEQKKQNVINGFVWTFGLLLFLILLGFLMFKLFEKMYKIKKLKADFKLTLQKFNIMISNIQSVSENIDTKYMAQLLKPVDNLIDDAILTTAKANKENLNKLERYYTEAYEISLKVNEYAKNYNIAIYSDSYLEKTNQLLSNIRKMSKTLEKFPIAPRLVFDNDKISVINQEIVKLVKTAKNTDVLGSVSVIDAVNNIIRYTEKVQSMERELKGVHDNIPVLRKALKNYKKSSDDLIKKLKSMNLITDAAKVEEMTKQFEKSVTFADEKLYMEYDNLDAILKYGMLKIRKVEEAIAAEKRRIEEEKQRIRRKKEEKEEEEERARKRRMSSSYGGSSYGGSSHSSSSFGGFGGGHSGGGGAGGRW